MSTVEVCTLNQIPTDTNVLGVVVEGVPLAICRTTSGEVYAVHDECTHERVKLSEGEVVDCTVECWVHGARFSLTTGAASPPAATPVATYPVSVEGDRVLVTVSSTTPSQDTTSPELPLVSSDPAGPSKEK